MTIARSQMNRQLYQLGGGIMQLNNGQEEPIFPRLETLSQNLGQAEQTLGEPTNQFNASSITTAITGRPPMNRGGVASLVDREKYGLGSKIKKFVRNIIPNEVAQVASVAAPFVAPFNPLLAAGMSALGNFDQTGRIGSSLLKGGLTYAGGQAARYIGGAGLQQGFSPFGGLGTNPSTLLGIPYSSPIGVESGLGQFLNPQAARVSELGPEVANLQSFYETVKYPTSVPTSAPGMLDKLGTVFSPSSNVDLGTRVRTAMDLTGDAIKKLYTDDKGNVNFKAVISTISLVPSYLDAKKKAQEAGIPPDQFNEQVFNQEKEFFRQRYASATPDVSYGITTPTGRIPVASIPTPVVQAAEGGLMDDTGGILSIKLTPAQAKAKGGMMGSEIPLRQNEGGITELDLRAKGGYIPVGIKEKADDVPAMLSKNEFVFTADAVRGAGDGNINKGAQKMYKLMKSLEKKVKKIKKVA